MGETGVSKELAARAIHLGSIRKDRPFMKINCGELNENFAENELFGHNKGAFAGEIMDKPGPIDEVKGGPSFFDEFGGIGSSLQAKVFSFYMDKVTGRTSTEILRKLDICFIHLLSRKRTNLEKALEIDMSMLCFMKRTKKAKK